MHLLDISQSTVNDDDLINAVKSGGDDRPSIIIDYSDGFTSAHAYKLVSLRNDDLVRLQNAMRWRGVRLTVAAGERLKVAAGVEAARAVFAGLPASEPAVQDPTGVEAALAAFAGKTAFSEPAVNVILRAVGDGSPDHTFVEIENDARQALSYDWAHREDGFVSIRIPLNLLPASQHPTEEQSAREDDAYKRGRHDAFAKSSAENRRLRDERNEARRDVYQLTQTVDKAQARIGELVRERQEEAKTPSTTYDKARKDRLAALLAILLA